MAESLWVLSSFLAPFSFFFWKVFLTFWLRSAACGILLPQGLNPWPLQWKCGVLTTGPPAKSFLLHFQRTPPLMVPFSAVQLLSHIWLFATPWTATCQASLSFTISRSLLKLMSIKSVMPSNHLILCPLLLLPSILSSIRIFSKESVLHIRWPKYWSFSFIISPSNEYSGLSPFRIDWFEALPLSF